MYRSRRSSICMMILLPRGRGDSDVDAGAYPPPRAKCNHHAALECSGVAGKLAREPVQFRDDSTAATASVRHQSATSRSEKSAKKPQYLDGASDSEPGVAPAERAARNATGRSGGVLAPRSQW